MLVYNLASLNYNNCIKIKIPILLFTSISFHYILSDFFMELTQWAEIVNLRTFGDNLRNKNVSLVVYTLKAY